ncbi:GD16397 [Drosophila simulans]|uniref:GD16397 n=1 Tax=Drosophila simulans TaxID=7240 RepID=B4R333_DROSI|nr:GD16397 [Drosophila simulans]
MFNIMLVKFVVIYALILASRRVEADDTSVLPEGFVDAAQRSTHTNNWAVLVDASRFWFNYRHVANVLSIYRSVKRLGIPDSQIILMIADDMACNARNPRPGQVYNNANQHINVYGDDNGTARSKKLLSDAGSNVLIYLTGHGGDGFLKFQDSEEITSQELADGIQQMWEKKRYNELFFMVDTCQAASLYEKFTSPNVLAVASSLVGEDSLSHHVDPSIGVYMIDRYTYYALEFLEKVQPFSKRTIGEFLQVCPKRVCISTVGVRKDLYRRDPHKVPITDFFGAIRPTRVSTDRINVTLANEDDFIFDKDKMVTKKPFKIVMESQFPSELFK